MVFVERRFATAVLDELVTIPMAGRAESLNVVLFFDVAGSAMTAGSAAITFAVKPSSVM